MKSTALFILIFISLLAGCSDSKNLDPMLNTKIPITISNMTKEYGYFNVCNEPIDPEGIEQTKCSPPMPLKKGISTLFVPPLKKAYPVFVTKTEDMYTCGTKANPLQQLPISTVKGFRKTLVLGSYILDKDKNKIAIACSVE